jgi:hypothetical protein
VIYSYKCCIGDCEETQACFSKEVLTSLFITFLQRSYVYASVLACKSLLSSFGISGALHLFRGSSLIPGLFTYSEVLDFGPRFWTSATPTTFPTSALESRKPVSHRRRHQYPSLCNFRSEPLFPERTPISRANPYSRASPYYIFPVYLVVFLRTLPYRETFTSLSPPNAVLLLPALLPALP